MAFIQYGETPAGLINGVNTTFTLTYAPNPPLSLILEVNGVGQIQGVAFDYTLNSNTITLAIAPLSGDSIFAISYTYGFIPGGAPAFQPTLPPTNSQVMNLGQLRNQVEIYLLNTSTDTASLSWSEVEINNYINEGIFYTQQVTEWYQDWDNLLMTASIGTYTAPPEVYQFKRLTWDRVFLPQTNEYELDRDDPSWRQSQPTTNPWRFYFPQMQQQFQVSPYPAPNNSGDSFTANQDIGCVTGIYETAANDGIFVFNQDLGIVIQGPLAQNEALVTYRPDRNYNPFSDRELGEMQILSTDHLNIGLGYVRIPDTLIYDTDIPQLPIQCNLALVFYALMKCFAREGEFQDINIAKGWFVAYGDWMESVLENKARWWATRVRSLEPFEEGSLFAKALFSIGYPMQLDLKPSYGA